MDKRGLLVLVFVLVLSFALINFTSAVINCNKLDSSVPPEMIFWECEDDQTCGEEINACYGGQKCEPHSSKTVTCENVCPGETVRCTCDNVGSGWVCEQCGDQCGETVLVQADCLEAGETTSDSTKCCDGFTIKSSSKCGWFDWFTCYTYTCTGCCEVKDGICNVNCDCEDGKYAGLYSTTKLRDVRSDYNKVRKQILRKYQKR